MRRVKSVMVREWVVALTTASTDLNDDRTWEQEICAHADQWVLLSSPPLFLRSPMCPSWQCTKGPAVAHLVSAVPTGLPMPQMSV